jgi:large subunit ribosomal protein L21
MKFAIIRTGGKQYFVKKDDEIVIDNLKQDKDSEVEFETLAKGDLEANTVELGKPSLKSGVKGVVMENGKGTKVRVARFKAKVRYRKVRGFRATLSQVKITSI